MFVLARPLSDLFFVACWDEGMEKKMATTIMGFIGTTMRTFSFTPSEPKTSLHSSQE